MNPLISITNQATKTDGHYNILCAETHERYETGLCKTNHSFYAFRHQSFKKWNTVYAPIPKNYDLMQENSIYRHINFDFVLSQNKFGQFQVLNNIARQLHLPLLSLEHTLPIAQWSKQMREDLKKMRGSVNVFISEYSCKEWGFDVDNKETFVIHHSVDNKLFKPDNQQERKVQILSVVNDWINRDWCCGFSIWNNIQKGLPVRVVGDTPGLSKPSSSIDELVHEYSSSAIFLNTSTVSPIPTALLEAMSCGCACVSTSNCMIPEIIEHGVNGLISNDEKELKGFCEDLIKNEALRYELGKNARKTIIEKFHPQSFIDKWNGLFNIMSERFFK